MLVIETILILLLAGISIMTVKSDLKEGLIHNKTLLIYVASGISLDALYYGIWCRGYVKEFIINFIIVAVISLVLYFSYSFAGGDCKLIITMALLYPAEFYWAYGSSYYTLFSVIGFACFYGYIYLLLTSILALVRGKNQLGKEYIKHYLTGFVKSFVSALIYISALNLVAQSLGLYQYVWTTWIVRILCLGVAWTVGKHSVLKRWYMLAGVFVLDMVLGFLLHVIPFSLNPESYTLVIVLLLCQMIIRTNLYETVQINDLKKGMILSTVSSLMMQGSRVRGLPGVSNEQLNCRLSEEEVSSIRRWAENRTITELSIVKKIPFAVFIVMGFWTYFALWRWLV